MGRVLPIEVHPVEPHGSEERNGAPNEFVDGLVRGDHVGEVIDARFPAANAKQDPQRVSTSLLQSVDSVVSKSRERSSRLIISSLLLSIGNLESVEFCGRQNTITKFREVEVRICSAWAL